MGTRQSRSGQDRPVAGQPGARQQDQQSNQQSDRGAQQGGDSQRSKQSDQVQHDQQGGTAGQHRQDASGALHGSGKASGQPGQQNVHGEGNYAASREYNDATKRFAKSGRVEGAARAAAPKSESDARQMEAAEAEGKRHAKGEDPALNRPSSSSASRDSSPTPRPGKDEE